MQTEAFPAPRGQAGQKTETERRTRLDQEWQVAPDDGGQSQVIIHNDDVTPMDFVVRVLTRIFELPLSRAEQVMLTAHFTGRALVSVLAREEAKHRVGQAHAAARAAGYPLKFTIE